MSDFSDKTLKVIEEKNITLQPRWSFLLRNYAVWFLFLLSVIFGSLAVATIIFMLSDFDWTAYKFLSQGAIKYELSAIPYFWIVIFIIFLIVAYYDFRRTKKGYIYNYYIIVLISLSASTVLGTALFFGGFNSQIHRLLLQQVPLYHKCVCTREDVWNQPDKGLLAGEITKINTQEEFTLEDFHEHSWNVQLKIEKWPEDVRYREGSVIKMKGLRDGVNGFVAREVSRW